MNMQKSENSSISPTISLERNNSNAHCQSKQKPLLVRDVPHPANIDTKDDTDTDDVLTFDVGYYTHEEYVYFTRPSIIIGNYRNTLETKQETKEEVQQKIEEKVPEEDCYNVPSYSGSPIATTLLDSPMNNAILEKKIPRTKNRNKKRKVLRKCQYVKPTKIAFTPYYRKTPTFGKKWSPFPFKMASD